ncbi:hypothetical protein SDC9_162649 [bioreactor metagenome]|uniref:Uncharacterized protein n=1 Tax=bioreactor metagenome TaxID=1076179 RepID=A0A645FPN1_9ZZZZ
MMLCPAEAMLSTERSVAACPEEVHRAPEPPSRAAIFASTAATVGFDMREYICPSVLRSNNSPSSSAEVNL